MLARGTISLRALLFLPKHASPKFSLPPFGVLGHNSIRSTASQSPSSSSPNKFSSSQNTSSSPSPPSPSPHEASEKTVNRSEHENSEHFVSRPSYEVPHYTFPHPVWSPEYAEAGVKITSQPKENVGDYIASFIVRCLRFNFDYISGYKFGKMTEDKWLVRMVFLETVAGCPGFVAAIVRHLTSLRRMTHDNGWIHTLLEEAENERMHLLTFIRLYKPGPLFRFGVLMTQGLVSNALTISYLLAPRVVHRFVGYLEEEAVKTYTHCLKEIDDPQGVLHHWRTKPAPKIAVEYWQLPPTATMRDVIVQVRADESHHREVNHTLSSLLQKDPTVKNPYSVRGLRSEEPPEAKK